MRSVLNCNNPFTDSSTNAKRTNKPDPNELWRLRSKLKYWHLASALSCRRRVQEFARREQINLGRKLRRLLRETETRAEPYPSVQEAANKNLCDSRNTLKTKGLWKRSSSENICPRKININILTKKQNKVTKDISFFDPLDFPLGILKVFKDFKHFLKF